MSDLLRSYFDTLHDPLVGRAAGFYGEKAAEEMLWLRTFMGLEACVTSDSISVLTHNGR